MPEDNLPGISHPDLAPPPDNQAEAAPEAQEQPTKLWAGKYATPEELETAKLASDREVQENLLPQLSLAKQEAELLRGMAERFGQPASPAKDPFEELEALGIPRDPVTRVLQSLVQAQLEPLYRASRAQQELAAELPDFTKHATEVSNFLSRNPTLQAEFNELNAVNPKAATKYVYREYQATLGNVTPRQSAATPASNGSVPSTQTSARTVNEVDWDERINKAREYAQQTGDDRAFFRVWFEAQKARTGQKFINPAIEQGG